MDKKGGFFRILGIIFLVIILLLVAAGVYAYYFHVFKEIRICVGEPLSTPLECTEDVDCTAQFVENMPAELEKAPEFIRDNFNDIIEASVYCEETCQVSEIRGIDPENGDLLDLESCNSSEEEILIKIRGKEGIQVLRFMASLEG